MKEVLSMPEAGDAIQDGVLSVGSIAVAAEGLPFGVTESALFTAVNSDSLRSVTAN